MAVTPGAVSLGAAVVFVLQDYRPSRPELLRHLRVVPRPGRRLHQDAVIAQRHPLGNGVIRLREMPARLVRSGHRGQNSCAISAWYHDLGGGCTRMLSSRSVTPLEMA